jgi:GNAT superfamily N-acetyltransferase
MSISVTYFAARRPLIEGGGPINSAAWPISWFRIAKGWGFLPAAFWPDQGPVEGTVMPNEPPNADEIAKRDRIPHYHRLRTEAACLYTVTQRHVVSVALEINESWYKAVKGRIEYREDLPVLAVHSIGISAFDFDSEEFVFPNTWGMEWGDRGFGSLPLGYLDTFMVEGWTCDVLNQNINQPQGPGISTILLLGKQSPFGIPHILEIYDGDNDTIVAWAHCLKKPYALDVEDVFVKPAYRQRKHGTELIRHIKGLAKSLSLPVRFWIPWGDHCDHNAPSLIAWCRKSGLRLESTNARWAAYLAAPGEPVSSLPSLQWVPQKTSCPLHLLSPSYEASNALDMNWTDDKALRRAELVEKKFHAGLTQAENDEFVTLQEEFGRYQDAIAPLPLD